MTMLAQAPNSPPRPLVALLVGSHFSPPATTILKALAQGARVGLVAEPDNPYDPGAIKVLVATEQIDLEALSTLSDELLDRGFVLIDIGSQPEWVLGHIGASGGKPLTKGLKLRPGLVGTHELGARVPCAAKLRFDGELILVELDKES